MIVEIKEICDTLSLLCLELLSSLGGAHGGQVLLRRWEVFIFVLFEEHKVQVVLILIEALFFSIADGLQTLQIVHLLEVLVDRDTSYVHLASLWRGLLEVIARYACLVLRLFLTPAVL